MNIQSCDFEFLDVRINRELDSERKLEHLQEQDGVYQHPTERGGKCWESPLVLQWTSNDDV